MLARTLLLAIQCVGVLAGSALRGAHGRTWEAVPGQVLGANDAVAAADEGRGAEGESATLLGVFFSSLLASFSPALGVLPLAFVQEDLKGWVGMGNAIACGMMGAAGLVLCTEGAEVSVLRTLLGVLLGAAFVLRSREWLKKHGDVEDGLVDMMSGGGGGAALGAKLPEHCSGGADDDGGASKGHGKAAKGKMLLLMAVMTLHCAAEGVGLGSSFGSGKGLGAFVTFALAVHNIPEGLAVGLVVAPRLGVPRAAAIAVLVHLPQPLMAVPAFLSVDSFAGVLPVGLGFAAGAMATTARTEILPDALAAAPEQLVWKVIASSAAFMLLLQAVVRE